MRLRRVAGRAAAGAAALAVTVLVSACTSSSDGSSSTAPSSISSTGSLASSAPGSSVATSATASASPSTPAARVVVRNGLALPDPDVTPGAALDGVTRAQVCTKTWNARHNKVSYGVQNEVSARYGVVAGNGTSLYLDQLIPASLGGTVTAANVWPQPLSQRKKKNALEAHLHQLVCLGELSLTTAQRAMAADWTAALRRYPPT